MSDSIRKDESQTDSVMEQSDQSTEETTVGTVEDQRSDNDRKRDEIAAAAKAQREEDRKSAALMNDPDLTEEEYNEAQGAAATSDDGEEGGSDSAELAQDDVSASDAEDAADSAPRGEEQTGWYTNGNGVRVKRLKVNGQFRELTEEQYDAALGKDLAGDDKLRAAAALNQQLQQRQADLDRRTQELEAQKQPPADAGADADKFRELSAKYHEAVFEGETETAGNLLYEMNQMGRPKGEPTPDLTKLTDQIARQVQTRLKDEAYNSAAKSGFQKFKEDYPELEGVPENLSYTNTLLQGILRDQPDLEPDKAILMAAAQASERLGVNGPATKQTDSGGDKREQREAAKGKLKPLPRGTARHKPTAAPQVDYSPEAKVERMRAARATGS